MKLPQMVHVHQKLEGPTLEDPREEAQKKIRSLSLRARNQRGGSVAITAGSRGVTNIRDILSTLVAEVKHLGLDPFIVPAMGSHGGATAEGQIKILQSEERALRSRRRDVTCKVQA